MFSNKFPLLSALFPLALWVSSFVFPIENCLICPIWAFWKSESHKKGGRAFRPCWRPFGGLSVTSQKTGVPPKCRKEGVGVNGPIFHDFSVFQKTHVFRILIHIISQSSLRNLNWNYRFTKKGRTLFFWIKLYFYKRNTLRKGVALRAVSWLFDCGLWKFTFF